MSVRGFGPTGGPTGKGAAKVCKTFIRRFDSDPRLQPNTHIIQALAADTQNRSGRSGRTFARPETANARRSAEPGPRGPSEADRLRPTLESTERILLSALLSRPPESVTDAELETALRLVMPGCKAKVVRV
jgi:hypothetical protein